MSSSKHEAGRSGNATVRAAAAAIVAACALLAGCGGSGFQPLYGSVATDTGRNNPLSNVAVATIPGRVGQQLRNELLFRKSGDQGVSAEYKLIIAIRESVKSTLVQLDGDARGRTYTIRAAFKLVRESDKSVVMNDVGTTQATYQRFSSIYSNLRARRDAEDRAARELAQVIRVRVAAVLQRTGS